MEHLWAPWRNTYVTSDKSKSQNLFYEIGQSEDDRAHYVVHRSKSSYAVLNRFPYNGGHLLVIPYRPVPEPKDLSEFETADLWATVNKMIEALKQAFHPDGFNVGLNIGEASGAGFPNHLHVHLVPRWKDDVNFLTAAALTRIHPNDLDTIYDALKKALASADA